MFDKFEIMVLDAILRLLLFRIEETQGDFDLYKSVDGSRLIVGRGEVSGLLEKVRKM